MSIQSDKGIINSIWLMDEEAVNRKNKPANAKNDAKLIQGIQQSASMMLSMLKDDGQIPMEFVNTYTLKAKSFYHTYLVVKHRNPDVVSSSVKVLMDDLRLASEGKEAEMLQLLRQQMVGGDRIDLMAILSEKRNLKRFSNMLARDIVFESLKECTKNEAMYCITDTGNKYHREDCPYCRGRYLLKVPFAMIENQKLKPCRCLSMAKDFDDGDLLYVTAFIDESIHTVMWDEKGEVGKAGSYSYIICRGNLRDESQVAEDNIITQGVEYSSEHEHIEKIAKQAVGKVLSTLAYELEFAGGVQIFTDNEPCATTWKNVPLNGKLVKSFSSVNVTFVHREKNKKADALGRTRMLLDVPMETYSEMIQNMNELEKLRYRVEILESENRDLRDTVQDLESKPWFLRRFFNYKFNDKRILT